MPLTRRQLLAAAAPTLLAGCATRRATVSTPASQARLPRVLVSPNRVIRTIVGLRPYRPSGFVVRVEKLDDKLLIHNYGHGGAGITMSWGTAKLAVDLAEAAGMRQAGVIGCGVIGLSTARLLQLRGYQVTIYAKALPPETTSNVAGGYWDPVTLYDSDRVTPEFRRQFGEAGRFAFRRFQSLTGGEYGVRWLPVYSLSTRGPRRIPGPESVYSEVDSLYPEAKQLTAAENPFSVPFAYRRYSLLIEPAIYLNALMRDFLIAKGEIVVREFSNPRDLLQLREPVLCNCTGLGAQKLFGDSELTPIRGQLTFLLPQPEIEYMTIGPGDIYMFPRRDGILLGGSHEEGDWSTEINTETRDRVLRENAALFNGMRS